MNTQFPKILCSRSKDGVTIVFNNKHWIKTGDDADTFYNAARNYFANRDQESLDALENKLFPHRRYLLSGELSEGNNGEVYFKDTNIPIPGHLKTQLFEFLDNGWPISSLKNFWYRAMLNPSKHGRDGFFKFCMDYGVVITNNGYALLYKAVTTKTSIPVELDLAAQVSQSYISLIRQGIDPSSYSVFLKESDEKDYLYYEIVSDEVGHDGTLIGTVSDVFVQIPEMAKNKPTTTYTDKYTRTMDIKLGVPVVKKRSECDPDINVSCSKGLHVGSYQYVKSFASYDDTVFACLVDPANVVALPESDNSKIRVCDYLPYAIMERSVDGEWTEIESSFFESDYEVHDAITLEARFNELLKSLDENPDPSLEDEITNKIYVVKTRMKNLSHVDVSVEVDVTQDTYNPSEKGFDEHCLDDDDYLDDEYDEDEDNDYLDDEDAAEDEVMTEEELFKDWSTQRRCGGTHLSYKDWVSSNS